MFICLARFTFCSSGEEPGYNFNDQSPYMCWFVAL